MSECVVRMEIPESCRKCINPVCIWLNDDWDIVENTIDAVKDFGRKNYDGFPVFCPIICSLPEGHGRLVDADALKEKAVHYSETEYHFDHDAVEMDDIDDAPTIVPAEAERSET